ncbi:hypothetical protein GCM10020370_50770 [Paenibacillus hodogayensis]
MEKQEVFLVSAASKAGEAFIRKLIQHRIPLVALANNAKEREKLEEMGVKKIVIVDTTDESTWVAPEYSITKIFLFESSQNLSCRYIRLCRSWTANAIVVITRSNKPRLMYRALGANCVIHTTNDDVSSLFQSLVG